MLALFCLFYLQWCLHVIWTIEAIFPLQLPESGQYLQLHLACDYSYETSEHINEYTDKNLKIYKTLLSAVKNMSIHISCLTLPSRTRIYTDRIKQQFQEKSKLEKESGFLIFQRFSVLCCFVFFPIMLLIFRHKGCRDCFSDISHSYSFSGNIGDVVRTSLNSLAILFLNNKTPN